MAIGRRESSPSVCAPISTKAPNSARRTTRPVTTDPTWEVPQRRLARFVLPRVGQRQADAVVLGIHTSYDYIERLANLDRLVDPCLLEDRDVRLGHHAPHRCPQMRQNPPRCGLVPLNGAPGLTVSRSTAARCAAFRGQACLRWVRELSLLWRRRLAPLPPRPLRSHCSVTMSCSLAIAPGLPNPEYAVSVA